MKYKILTSLFAFALMFAIGASTLYAQTQDCSPSTDTTCSQTTNIKFDNPFSKTGGNLLGLINAIVDNIVLPIGGVLCVLAFIWGGFQFVMAQGNEKKLGEAKRTVGYAVIGTVLILGAYAITDVITGTINQLK